MGGGLPCAAFGGRAEIMSRLAPAGPVYQAGTLSGNPLAVGGRAGHAARLHPGGVRAGRRLRGRAGTLVSAALTRTGVPHYLSTAGSLFTMFLGRTAPVRDFADAKDQSTAAYAAFFHAMLDGGVYLPPSALRGVVRLRRARRRSAGAHRRRSPRCGRGRRRRAARLTAAACAAALRA